MPDNERQAEIEAEAQRIGYLLCIQKAHCNACPCTPCVDDARFVLDRARDARHDEVHLSDKARAMIVSQQIMGDARSPQGEDHEVGRLAKLAALAERDPYDVEAVRAYNDECKRISAAQGDDHEAVGHEAGIEAAARVNHAMYPQQDYEEAHMEAERIIAAYLSRMSPARDAPAGRGEK